MTVRAIRRFSKAEAFSQFWGRPALAAKMVRQMPPDAAIDPDADPADKVASDNRHSGQPIEGEGAR
jgi:hypothetical protein